MENTNLKKPDWEKIGAYMFIVVSLSSLFFYIADMKERTAKVEEKIVKETADLQLLSVQFINGKRIDTIKYNGKIHVFEEDIK